MNNLIILAILLITIALANPEAQQVSGFSYKPSFFEYFSRSGPIVSMRYSIQPRNVPSNLKNYDFRGKLWCAIQILSEDKNRQRLRLTVVRLDNQMDKRNENYDSLYRNTDKIWREFMGWPEELLLTITSHGSRQIIIPANMHHEILQMDFDGNGMHHVVNVDREIPKLIFQVTTNRKGQYKPLLHKCGTLSRIMNPNWKYYGIPLDQIKPATQKLKESQALKALNTLRPVAYQIDLFRLVILYHFGGVYTDTRLTPVVSYEELLPKTGGVIVDDADRIGFYNAFLAFPKHSILARAGIQQIIVHVQQRYYGNNCLAPTGPHALAKAYHELLTADQRRQYHISMELENGNAVWIKDSTTKENLILSHNGEYRRRFSARNHDHYPALYDRRSIYN